MGKLLFTSESVSNGHPDKVADQISDQILDKYLEKDENSRVAVETFLTGNTILIGGEVTSKHKFSLEEIRKIVKNKLVEIGYKDDESGLNPEKVEILVKLSEQSSEIADGVFNALEKREGSVDSLDAQGAGDQGIMFGFACNDNTSYFPIAGRLAHLLMEEHAKLRKQEDCILLPDAKSQVTIEYFDNSPVRIDNILISTQHTKNTSLEEVKEYVTNKLIIPTLDKYFKNESNFDHLANSLPKILINPAGEWNIGGPVSDAGLTGRKIIVDTYTGSARHGGGAFSGKDPSKVDRSAAYALRWIAKNLIAAGAAREIELQASYAIGSSEPVSVGITSIKDNKVAECIIIKAIEEAFDLRPAAIIRNLNLKSFNAYSKTAVYGHFGKTKDDYPWERLDKVEELKGLLGLQ